MTNEQNRNSPAPSRQLREIFAALMRSGDVAVEMIRTKATQMVQP